MSARRDNPLWREFRRQRGSAPRDVLERFAQNRYTGEVVIARFDRTQVAHRRNRRLLVRQWARFANDPLLRPVITVEEFDATPRAYRASVAVCALRRCPLCRALLSSDRHVGGFVACFACLRFRRPLLAHYPKSADDAVVRLP